MSKENNTRNNVWKWLVLALLAAVSVHVTNPPKDKIRLGDRKSTRLNSSHGY